VLKGFRGWGLGISAGVMALAAIVMSSGVRAAGPADDLPDGEGKKILLTSCTSCHELTEVTKFRGYYDRRQWRDIVVTMMEYGAPIEEKQVDVLADYLAANLGKP
jgi:competence protein ComEA